MKFIICILFILTGGWLQAQTSFYDQALALTSGKVINMSSFKERKVLLVILSPTSLREKSSEKYLGKIQSEFPDLSVIVLQSNIGADTTSFTDVKQYDTISNTSFSNVVSGGKDQAQTDPLLHWLTDSTSNLHFRTNTISDEQLYVISESGVLYAVLGKGVSDALLKEILTAKDVKPQQIITDDNRKDYVKPR